MTRLKVENLNFSYEKDIALLQNINLEFTDEPTAIIGQNGAGKSTFVKLLKGLLKPTSGNILINHLHVQNETPAKLAKHIGLIFQNPNEQIFKNKVMDEVMFGPLNIGQSEEEARQNAIHALEAVQLTDKVEQNPYDLSLSQRKLITVASVLAMKTEIIIFDEPTMGQDYVGKEMLKTIIRDLRQDGKLVLCILHDMDFVADVFERTIVLNQGKVLLDGNTRDVFSNEAILKSANLEQPHITQLGRQLGFSGPFLHEDELIAQLKNR